MNPSKKIHTYARQYCIDRFDLWATRYAKLAKGGGNRVGADYTDKAYSMFPRYNVLSAILLDIETLDYDSLPSLSELVELLQVAGDSANTIFTQSLENEIAISVTENERELFIDEIKKVAEKGLGLIEPLFYRRVLSETEVSELWDKIETHWGTSRAYWYPLAEKTHPSLKALGVSDANHALVQKEIRSFLRTLKIDRVFELREFGEENYLIDTAIADFEYSSAEGYWISEAKDWIVYCSHEGTITLGGSISSIAE